MGQGSFQRQANPPSALPLSALAMTVSQRPPLDRGALVLVQRKQNTLSSEKKEPLPQQKVGCTAMEPLEHRRNMANPFHVPRSVPPTPFLQDGGPPPPTPYPAGL